MASPYPDPMRKSPHTCVAHGEIAKDMHTLADAVERIENGIATINSRLGRGDCDFTQIETRLRSVEERMAGDRDPGQLLTRMGMIERVVYGAVGTAGAALVIAVLSMVLKG